MCSYVKSLKPRVLIYSFTRTRGIGKNMKSKSLIKRNGSDTQVKHPILLKYNAKIDLGITLALREFNKAFIGDRYYKVIEH